MPETTIETAELLAKLESNRRLLWDLEAEQRGAAARGESLGGSKLAGLKIARHVIDDVVKEVRATGLGVCRVCYCTDLTACQTMGPDARVLHCHWVETAGLGQVCSECIEEDLERRYLETVWTLGLTFGTPMVASAAKAGDIVVRALEERIVEVHWEDNVTIATATRVWVCDPQEAFAHRAVPRSFKALLDPSIAEASRRAIVVKAFHDGKLHDRERASRLLGVNLETGEPLGP